MENLKSVFTNQAGHMDQENRTIKIQKLEKERSRVMAEYHEVAKKLDFIDYQLHELKKQAIEIKM